jgi:hypothetical protein
MHVKTRMESREILHCAQIKDYTVNCAFVQPNSFLTMWRRLQTQLDNLYLRVSSADNGPELSPF